MASWRLRGASLVLLWPLSGGCWRLLLAAWWLPGLLSRACLVAADWRLAAWTVVSRLSCGRWLPVWRLAAGCLVPVWLLSGGWLGASLVALSCGCLTAYLATD